MIPNKRIKLQEKMKGMQSNKYASKYKRVMMLNIQEINNNTLEVNMYSGKNV